ncbi:MAG: NAD-dependent epimerase/dehydratase family protein [Candidatus Omnitrophica bacterium]|nr:NAD-dependent epimerase/dehydratase family protein [Candidatus Omnitrophota bacterium]
MVRAFLGPNATLDNIVPRPGDGQVFIRARPLQAEPFPLHNPTMHNLVTGGTGYFGGRLVEGLLDRGETVRAIRRMTSDVSRLSGAVELMQGDVTDPASLARAMEDCDRVFHTAALVKTWDPDPEAFHRINVEGARNVALAAKSAGIPLIYTSSFFALGPTGEHPVDEDHSRPAPNYFTEYEKTKTEADQMIRKMNEEEGLGAIILYPGVIYGPGPLTQGNHVSQLVRDFLRHKVPGVPGNGSQRWTYSHIDDVVEGHLLAAEKAVPGSRYILGGPIATLDETFAILAEATGQKPPRFHLPIGLLKGFGWIGEMAGHITGKAPEVTRGVAETYRHHWAFSSKRAETELGYAMKDLKAGLTDVVDYLKAFSK